jgi:predicted acetyltransferase
VSTPDLPMTTVDPADTDALRAWANAATIVFLSPRPTDHDLELRRERFAGHRLFAAKDGGSTVATFRSFDTTLDVPGGSVEANAISSVTVLPTHRRSGLLTRWMTGELRRAAEAGVPASILIASEAPIYGRFGFGTAATACTWTLDARTASFLPPRSGRVEIVDPEVFATEAADVYARARRRQPGALARRDIWWETLAQLRSSPEGPDRHRVLALHRGASGVVDGALAYKVVDDWSERVSTSRLEVVDLVAADDAAYADLWRYCCEVDFVAEVRAPDRSPAEALPWLLSDPRAARSGPVADFLWARLHDVPAALSARRYPVPGRVVLEVEDALAGAVGGRVAGRWLLDVGPDGRATCAPTGADADAHVAADVLAGLWLGGVPAATLHRAGRLHVTGPDVLGRLQALFGWPDPAWCGTWF